MAAKRDPRATGCRRDLGQSVVEMALILPIFLSICLGILDLGRAFYNYERIQNAAREGAAWLSLRPTPDDWPVGVANAAAAVTPRVESEGVDCADGPVQVTSAAVVNQQATVTVSCGFDLVTPFMGAVLSNTPPCTNLIGISLCQPNQRIVLRGRAQMPVVWTGG